MNDQGYIRAPRSQEDISEAQGGAETTEIYSRIMGDRRVGSVDVASATKHDYCTEFSIAWRYRDNNVSGKEILHSSTNGMEILHIPFLDNEVCQSVNVGLL